MSKVQAKAKKLINLPDKEYNTMWSREKEFKFIKSFEDPRFGKVTIVKNHKTGEIMMVKEKLLDNKARATKDILELKQRMNLNHPQLMQLEGYSTSVKKNLCSTHYISRAFYRYPKTDMDREFKLRQGNTTDFTGDELNNLTLNALGGLNSLHEKGLHHGDIRPKFLGYDKVNNNNAILDRLKDPSPIEVTQRNNLMTKNIKTYMSPQLYNKLQGHDKKQKYNVQKNDMWSLGMSVLQLGTMDSVEDVYQSNGKINKVKLKEHKDDFQNRYSQTNPGLVNGVFSLLDENEENRPTTGQLGLMMEDGGQGYNYPPTQPIRNVNSTPPVEYDNTGNDFFNKEEKVVNANPNPISNTTNIHEQEDNPYMQSNNFFKAPKTNYVQSTPENTYVQPAPQTNTYIQQQPLPTTTYSNEPVYTQPTQTYVQSTPQTTYVENTPQTYVQNTPQTYVQNTPQTTYVQNTPQTYVNTTETYVQNTPQTYVQNTPQTYVQNTPQNTYVNQNAVSKDPVLLRTYVDNSNAQINTTSTTNFTEYVQNQPTTQTYVQSTPQYYTDNQPEVQQQYTYVNQQPTTVQFSETQQKTYVNAEPQISYAQPTTTYVNAEPQVTYVQSTPQTMPTYVNAEPQVTYVQPTTSYINAEPQISYAQPTTTYVNAEPQVTYMQSTPHTTLTNNTTTYVNSQPDNQSRFVNAQITNGHLTSGQLTSGQLTSGHLTSGQLISGQLTSGQLTSGLYTNQSYTTKTVQNNGGFYPGTSQLNGDVEIRRGSYIPPQNTGQVVSEKKRYVMQEDGTVIEVDPTTELENAE